MQKWAEPVIVRKGQQKLIDERALRENLGNYQLQIFKKGKKATHRKRENILSTYMSRCSWGCAQRTEGMPAGKSETGHRKCTVQ